MSLGAVPASAADGPPRFLPLTPPASDVPKPGAIRFLTSNDFPPFNFVDGSGRLTGYNVELARAICLKLAIPCTVQARPFPVLVQSLRDNMGDAIIAGLADTPTLRRFVLYSDPYLRLPARFVVPREAARPATPEGMAGARVAVAAGTQYAAFLKDFFPAATAVAMDSEEAALDALKAGTVEAVFSGALSASFWLAGPNGRTCCTFAEGAYTESAYFGRGLTLQVARDNPGLKKVLDAALQSVEKDGVLADLYFRFFPVALY